MQFLVLLLLSVACMPIRWPAPPDWIGYRGGILLTWGAVASIVGAVLGLARWTRGTLSRDPSLSLMILRRQGKWRFYHLISMVGVFVLALYVFGWGWIVQGGVPPDLPAVDQLPGAELLVLAPFLVSLFLSWLCFYDVDRALHDARSESHEAAPFWSRWAYVGFHLRNNLVLVFVPILLMVLANGLPRLIPQDSGFGQAMAACASLVTALGVFTLMPWIVRIILGLRPMPQGELRDRLMTLSRHLRCRCSDILLWNTRGGIANAMVVGLFPFLRYVVLTDRLIHEMTTEEVEAVFGHEIGHVKHRHMIYYLGFLFISLAVVTQMWDALNIESLLNLESRKDLAVLPLVAMLGAYVFLVFGFISRRCERQADIYGCRAVSCDRADCLNHPEDQPLIPSGRGLCPTGIRIFISALEKVASLNGISRDRPGWLQSWQHSTIARRVEFLDRLISDRSLEARFQRRVGLVKLALFVSMSLLFLLFAFNWGWAPLLAF